MTPAPDEPRRGMKKIRRMARRTLTRLGVLRVPPYTGDYLQAPFLRALGGLKVETIFEFGAGDGADTLRLRERFGAVVHAFECNPFILPELHARLDGQAGIRLVERAVWDADGPLPFYPVVRTVWNGNVVSNPGASSCFRAVRGYHQEYEQAEIFVEAIRLDTYCDREGLRAPDLLCIDAQGAALRALRGLGRYLDGVSAIIVEIEHREVFAGEDLYPAVHAFLEQAGFREAVVIEHDGWYNNYLYRRTLPAIANSS
jgi:FkbM family methyltransferase